ncbi:MAG: hypothetical protein ACRC8Q_09515 [Aeromonas sp.]
MLKKDLPAMVTASLPHRTADALMKRLTAIKWTPPSEDPLDPIHQVHLPPIQPFSRTPSPDPTRTAGIDHQDEWKRRMTDIILRDLREPPLQADRLRAITLSLLENRMSISEGAKAVEDKVAQIFPTLWHSKQHSPTVTQPPGKPRELRRRQYANIQKMLCASRKDTKAVLDGSWRTLVKSRESPELIDFGANVLGKIGPSLKIRRSEPADNHWALLEPIPVEELRDSLRSLGTSAVGMDRISAPTLLSWHLPSLASLLNLFLLTECLPWRRQG